MCMLSVSSDGKLVSKGSQGSTYMGVGEEIADNLLTMRTFQSNAVVHIETVLKRTVCVFGDRYEVETTLTTRN